MGPPRAQGAFCQITLTSCLRRPKTETNRLTYTVHAKATGELISIGFRDRWVHSLVSAKCSANHRVQTKKRLHFLAYLWSQSEFTTQRQSQRKTDPESELNLWEIPFCRRSWSVSEKDRHRGHCDPSDHTNRRRPHRTISPQNLNSTPPTTESSVLQTYTRLLCTAALAQLCHECCVCLSHAGNASKLLTGRTLSRQCKILWQFHDISMTVCGTSAHAKCYSYHANTSVIVSGGDRNATMHDLKPKWNAQTPQ